MLDVQLILSNQYYYELVCTDMFIFPISNDYHFITCKILQRHCMYYCFHLFETEYRLWNVD